MKDLGIYIHTPFCKKKCKYCDFISFDSKQNKVEEYFKCLEKEINNFDMSKINGSKIASIYFGGGTPSYPESEYIINILKLLKNKFEIKDDAEITIEVNPGTVSKEKLNNYYVAGFNRISIGLQACQDRLLNLIGRIHTYSEFEETYKNAKEVGFKNINVDLMLGLPTQTKDELIESLNKIIYLKPDHISLYSLIVEENTVLKEKLDNKKYELPDEKEERKMYHLTKKILEKNGYNHYEISNFSKHGKESKHNLACWNQEEYLGFGVASSSYLNRKRYSVVKDLDLYIKNITDNNFDENIIIEEIQTDESIKKEYMMIGLRKIEGVSIQEFERKFRINPLFYFRFEIEKLTNEDLLEVDLDKIKLTQKGLDLANIVFMEFI